MTKWSGCLAVFAVALATGLGPAARAQGNCSPALGHPPLVQEGSLIAAINPTVAPIQYIDDSGKLIGLDVDLGNEIAKRLCLKMAFQSTQFATMIPLLKEGRIDMIDSFMFYTPDRAAQVLMIPYGASTMAIVVPKSNTDKIDGPEYFSGKSFGVELGTVDYHDAQTASAALQKAGKPPIDIHTFDTYATVLQALSAGQVQGAFIGTEEAYYYRNKGVDFFRICPDRLRPACRGAGLQGASHRRRRRQGDERHAHGRDLRQDFQAIRTLRAAGAVQDNQWPDPGSELHGAAPITAASIWTGAGADMKAPDDPAASDRRILSGTTPGAATPAPPLQRTGSTRPENRPA